MQLMPHEGVRVGLLHRRIGAHGGVGIDHRRKRLGGCCRNGNIKII
jgi:hypothetical protein